MRERRFTPGPLRRKDVYPGALVDGQTVKASLATGIAHRMTGLLTSRGEREEALAEGQLHAAGALTRPNVVAVISLKGGVGKTSCAYLVGTLLASRKRLRVLAVDANPDFGTLASMAPDRLRSPNDAADLDEQLESVATGAGLRSFVTVLPSGLHILAAPDGPDATATMRPERFGTLLVFLAQFYDLIVLDMGTGIVGPLVQLGVSRADHVLVVTDQEFETTGRVLSALRHLESPHHKDAAGPFGRVTAILNKTPSHGDTESFRDAFDVAGVRRQIVIPHDDQLATMLDSGSYTLEGLRRPTRMAIREMGLAVAQRLV